MDNYEIGKNSIIKKIIMILAYIAVEYEDIDKEQVWSWTQQNVLLQSCFLWYHKASYTL